VWTRFMAVGIARMPINPVSFPIAESLCVAAWHPVSGSNLPLFDYLRPRINPF